MDSARTCFVPAGRHLVRKQRVEHLLEVARHHNQPLDRLPQQHKRLAQVGQQAVEAVDLLQQHRRERVHLARLRVAIEEPF